MTGSGRSSVARCALIVFFVAHTVATQPLPAFAGVLTGQWTGRAGECQLALEEYDREILHLRMRREGGAWDACTPEAAALAAALESLLRAARAEREGTFTLFLGRVVELPRLSAELVRTARQSREWDTRTGRPRAGDPNGFVAGILAQTPALRDLFPAYAIASVSVEKVLVPSSAEIRARKERDPAPGERIPYDAMIWVRLKSRR